MHTFFFLFDVVYVIRCACLLPHGYTVIHHLKSVDISSVTTFSFFVATMILSHSIHVTQSEINLNNSALFSFTLRNFASSLELVFRN